jgi:hypothetical protein
MYSKRKIQKTLDAFEKSEGWMPVYHTLDEVNEFKEFINSIVKIESNSKNAWIESVKPISEKRQKEITRWIENEQALCSVDSGYFESRYAYITDECGKITKFQNRKSQEVIDSVIADLEDRDLGIELLILGARQNGTSIKILLKLLHRTLFVPNTQTIISAMMSNKCDYIKQTLDIIYDKLPFWLPSIKIPKGAFNNQSRMSVQPGRSTTGIAQGLTPQCIYVTGVEDFPTPMKTIEEGLLRAVHTSRNTFLVLHGMKESNSDWLNSTYKYAKEYWPQGKFRLCPVFIPWVMCSDLYPQADWLRKFPIPKGWKPIKETEENKRKCELFVRTTPYLTKIIGNDWCMPLAQQWYWEFNYREAKLRGTLEHFEKMFAPDDGEPLAEQVVESDGEIDFEALFPSPTKMQEEVASIRQRLLEAK